MFLFKLLLFKLIEFILLESHIFLTGANGQLGKVIAKILSLDGSKVYGLDIHPNSTNQYLANYTKGSVTNRESFRTLFNSISNPHENLNISLVNNAGVSIFTPSEERDLEEFRQVTEVNMLGPIYGMTEFYAFAKSLNKLSSFENNYSIINIASVYGMVAPNMKIYSDTSRQNSEIYGASKAGLIQMTKYFATRYASIPININSISPGGVLNKKLQGDKFISNYSELVPLNRLCEEEEIGQAVSMLLNSSNKYLTGQNIAIDGGLTSW